MSGEHSPLLTNALCEDEKNQVILRSHSNSSPVCRCAWLSCGLVFAIVVVNAFYDGGLDLEVLTTERLGRIYTYDKAEEQADKYQQFVRKKHATSAKDGCEGTVLITRHCEKGHVREHCSYDGLERSVYFATLFGDSDLERWPAPSYIYATNPGGRKNRLKRNYREIELVQPLADKVNITINEDYYGRRNKLLAKDILKKFRTGEMCGKLAIVSWKHSRIPSLANKLGCGPNEGCPLDFPPYSFDQVWEIKLVYRSINHSERKSFKLPKNPEWRVYGSVQQQGFDPLSFSKHYGDYPKGGIATGGRWEEDTHSMPERIRVSRKEIIEPEGVTKGAV